LQCIEHNANEKNQKKRITPVYVEQNCIHGKGLFTLRNIKKVNQLVPSNTVRWGVKIPEF